MKLNGSEIIVECLKEQGVDTIFGLSHRRIPFLLFHTYTSFTFFQYTYGCLFIIHSNI